MPAADVEQQVTEALDRVGLAARADDRLAHLSGGMLRRVGVAQAVVNRPRLLVLDDLAAAGGPEQPGDSPLERGYAAVVAAVEETRNG